MTWRRSDMWSSTSSEALSPGRISQARTRTKNTKTLKRKSWRPVWTSSARATPWNSRSTWSTAAHWNSSRTQTTSIALVSSTSAWSAITLTPRFWTILGSRIDFQKTRSCSSPQCSMSFAKSLRFRRRQTPIIQSCLARVETQAWTLEWTRAWEPCRAITAEGKQVAPWWVCSRLQLPTNSPHSRTLKPKEEPPTLNNSSMTREDLTSRKLLSKCLIRNDKLLIWPGCRWRTLFLLFA